MQKQPKVLLLGGEGFLGSGLKNVLAKRNVETVPIDINDCDISDPMCISFLAMQISTVTHVVLLASKIGAKLFNSEPVQAAECNKKIFDNVLRAIATSYEMSQNEVDFTYYSTCEIFGSMNSPLDFQHFTEKPNLIASDRMLYSKVKLDAEKSTIIFSTMNPQIMPHYKIIRPFNISGSMQKRGVVHDMLRSAFEANKISYSACTTRTITPIGYASEIACDAILGNMSGAFNVYDECGSVYMNTLASMLKRILEQRYGYSQIALIELPADDNIQYRNISLPDSRLDEFSCKLETIVDSIVKENKWSKEHA